MSARHRSHSVLSKRHHRSKPAKGGGFTGSCLMIVWIVLYFTGALRKLFFKPPAEFRDIDTVFLVLLIAGPIVGGALLYKYVKKYLINKHGEEDGLKKLQKLDNIFGFVSLALLGTVLILLITNFEKIFIN